MPDQRIRKLIPFIIDQVRDVGGSLPKTKLVKLLYLIDVATTRHLGRPLTGIHWKYWHYGPYSTEIEDAIRDVVGKSVDQLEVITKDGRRVFAYEPTQSEDIEREYSLEERILIYNALNRWAGEELRDILNYVYFETEPMAQANWGEPLNMDLVRRALDEQQWELAEIIAQIPENKLMEFRKKLREAVEETKSRQIPLPAHDSVFLEGALIADGEERKGRKRLIGSKGVLSPRGRGTDNK